KVLVLMPQQVFLYRLPKGCVLTILNWKKLLLYLEEMDRSILKMDSIALKKNSMKRAVSFLRSLPFLTSLISDGSQEIQKQLYQLRVRLSLPVGLPKNILAIGKLLLEDRSNTITKMYSW